MWSKVSFWFSILTLAFASFVFYPRWEKPKAESTLGWDVSGYYWYLPSIFIYHDLKGQHFKDDIIRKYSLTNSEFQQGFQHESGNYVMKYSSGMAIMYSPFFAIAHLLAKPTGYPAGGFSTPYQLAIQCGGLLIAMIGLWYLRKLLLKFYSDKAVGVSLLLLVVGSNYLNYAGIDVGLSHNWLFTVYVFILLGTYHFYKKPLLRYAVAIGLLCGLATLIRPTDIISLIIPLLWGLRTLHQKEIKNQLQFLYDNLRFIIVSVACFTFVVSIQLFYWKYAANDWIVYSYQGQGFTWKSPHIFAYLFSTHNGWLSYSPLLAFSVFGIVKMAREGNSYLYILLFTVVNIYVISCWEFYWYGGRFMVQSYALLMIPFTAFIQWVIEKKLRIIVVMPIILLCAYIGLWTNIHYHYGNMYDWDTTNRTYYLASIGRWSATDKLIKLRDNPEIYKGKYTSKRLIYSNDFEDDTLYSCGQPPILGAHSICVDSKKDLAKFSFAYTHQNADWLQAEAIFHCTLKEWSVWDMTQFIVSFEQKGKVIKSGLIRIHRFLEDNETARLFIDTKLPKEEFDSVTISFWRAGGDKTVVIDDLNVYFFN